MTIAASGWIPSNVQIINKNAGWGDGRDSSLVQLTIQHDANWSGTTDASEYTSPRWMPVPAPSLVGFHGRIDYVIPICPFVARAVNSRFVEFGYEPPTAAVPDTPGRFRMRGAFGAGDGPTYPLEVSAGTLVTEFMTSETYDGYALFVGR